MSAVIQEGSLNPLKERMAKVDSKIVAPVELIVIAWPVPSPMAETAPTAPTNRVVPPTNNVKSKAPFSVLLNVTPIVGLGLAALVLGETLTPVKIGAVIVIFVGVYLANRR